MSALFEIKNLRKSFGENLVLDDVSINFPAQSATVIIGASGSGKSTLMRCMNLLEELNDGQINLDGADISAYGTDIDTVRGQIGSVFQAFNLFPHLSVVDNITLAPRLVHGVKKDVADKNARELLKRFGLLEKADEFPNLLSGGQQQRVAIARALAVDPLIILADEPTGNLDSRSGAEILDLFDELHEQGKTLIMVTHSDELAERSARWVRLRDGLVESDERRT